MTPEPTRRILDPEKPVFAKDIKKYRLEALDKPEWDLSIDSHDDTYIKQDLEQIKDQKKS